MGFSAPDASPPSPPPSAYYGRAPVDCGDNACLRADTDFGHDKKNNSTPGVQRDNRHSTEKNVPTNASSAPSVSPAMISHATTVRTGACAGIDVAFLRVSTSGGKVRPQIMPRAERTTTGIHNSNKDLRREAYEIAYQIRDLMHEGEATHGSNIFMVDEKKLRARLNDIASTSPVMDGFMRSRIHPILRSPPVKKEDVLLLRKEKIERLLTSNKIHGEKKRVLQKELAEIDRQVSMRPEVRKRQYLTAIKELNAVLQHKKRIRAHGQDISASLGDGDAHRKIERGIRNFDHNRTVVAARRNRDARFKEKRRSIGLDDQRLFYDGFKIDEERDSYVRRIHAVIYSRSHVEAMTKADILADRREDRILHAEYKDAEDLQKHIREEEIKAAELKFSTTVSAMATEAAIRETEIINGEIARRVRSMMDNTYESLVPVPERRKSRRRDPKRSDAIPLERRFTEIAI